MTKKKVLVMVLAADIAGYDALVKAIQSTWGRYRSDYFKIIYYYGYRNGHPKPEPGKVLQIGDDIICGCEEGVHEICQKTLMAYEYVYSKFEFDYTFRCCCGSYVVRDELMKFIEDKPAEGFYCGARGGSDDVPFASGSGYFLSRDLVGEVVRNKERILKYPYPGYHDDVAIGKFMQEIGVVIDPTARREDSSNIVPDQYHYHVRKDGNGQPLYEIDSKLALKKQMKKA